MTFNFLKDTIIFCVLGIFIPRFTAVLFFLLQILTDKLNIGCEVYWTSIWIVTSIISLIAPLIYYKTIEKTKNTTLTKLTLFNF